MDRPCFKRPSASTPITPTRTVPASMISLTPKCAPTSKRAWSGADFLEAGLRSLLYVMRGGGADERQFNALEVIRDTAPENARVSFSKLKSILRQQAALLRADEARAMAAIPAMLPQDPGRRQKVIDTIAEVASAKGTLDSESAQRLDEVRNLFGCGNTSAQPPPRPILVNAKRMT